MMFLEGKVNTQELKKARKIKNNRKVLNLNNCTIITLLI